jgi:hypothetical protein
MVRATALHRCAFVNIRHSEHRLGMLAGWVIGRVVLKL